MPLRISKELMIAHLLIYLAFPYLSSCNLDINNYPKDIVNYLEPLHESLVNSSNLVIPEEQSSRDVLLQKRGLRLTARQFICDPGYGLCPGLTILTSYLIYVGTSKCCPLGGQCCSTGCCLPGEDCCGHDRAKIGDTCCGASGYSCHD